LFVLCFALILTVAASKCTSLEGDCGEGIVKYTVQFNVNWKGVPTYYDRLYNIYDECQNCEKRSYTILFHERLNCETKDNQAFQCIATVESVWARVWIVSYYKDVIKYCGEKWSKRYQNLMKVPCVIDEVDVMEFYKRQVGKTSAINVEIKDRKPVEYGGFHYGGECVWEYEIEGIWSTLVITIVCISACVLIFIIGLYIYANKHRHEKRNSLLDQPVAEGEKTVPSV
ncbi:hypothetical protein WA556_004139, partial [Blastocystis sp. ATCC 50177/Nand II]